MSVHDDTVVATLVEMVRSVYTHATHATYDLQMRCLNRVTGECDTVGSMS
eukprot:m.406966 g.406966  ORF g.406966 m.406966 type:complete len:50 (-) comp21218_c1_seq10:678-827(-)